MYIFVDTLFKETKMSEFKSEIISDSINPNNNRVTTFLLTYPRFIHSELMTHRTFSRNAASSRAIPIDKIIQQVRANPAMPTRWGKNGKGMQDHGNMNDNEITACKNAWIDAANSAADNAEKLKELGLHKQIVNRILEPFMWMTTLVTATEWQNFFALRLHKDAQPEFQHLSHLMLQKYLSSHPQNKNWDEWHIPFGDQTGDNADLDTKLKIATARAARTSYMTITSVIDIQKDVELHNNLASSGHWSPFEHACIADRDGSGNFVGWKQYRHFFAEENRSCNLNKLLEDYETKCA
jgi:thymidylate synthase ThyX